MAAQDDSVVAAAVHFVVVVLAPRLLAEHQGDVVLRRCLEGDAAPARLPEAKLLAPGALKGGNRQGSLGLLDKSHCYCPRQLMSCVNGSQDAKIKRREQGSTATE